MARQSSLTLTEELEKLEQSITLTLQEIDHNFSRAHRIVTSSILPIVEQYADHSRQVWDGSKFWKQFFESSANVSLSGYEEQPSTHQNMDDTVTEDSSTATQTTLEGSESYNTPSSAHYSIRQDEEGMDLSSLTISPSHSTPRPAAKNKQQGSRGGQQQQQSPPPPKFADYPSPYEALRREVSQRAGPNQHQVQDTPSTPSASSAMTDRTQNLAVTPDAIKPTPLPSRRDEPTSIPRPSTSRKKTDPLLHRVLDRNYRVQATPIARARYGVFPNSRIADAAAEVGAEIGTTTPVTAARARLGESTLSSSPDIPEPPQLHPDIFCSPVRKPRTPGVSVLTPRNPNTANKRNASRWSGVAAGSRDSDEEDFNGDDDDAGFPFGQSPPKTMQFHIPQSRLLKTPAREASKRIVEDLLLTAGVGSGAGGDGDEEDTTDDLTHLRARERERGTFLGMGEDETSPTMVRTAAAFEDESF